jgi:hypothetical protein
MKHAAPLALLLGAAAIAAVTHPLLTYSLSLATFGLAHALVELRVLDVRYRRVLVRPELATVVVALAVVLVVRCMANLHWIARDTSHTLELVAGVSSVVVLLPRAVLRGRTHAAITLGVAIALAIGLALSPLGTLLVLAVVHNLAPWPLVAAVAEPNARRQLWRIGAVVYVAIPLVIATGWPYAWLSGLASPEATVLPTGPLFDHMGAFAGPSPLDHPEAALHVFAACAYLQCAHYVGVLLVLPSQAPATMRVSPRIVATIVAIAALGLALYALDFAAARSWYGTIAGVHAWAEFPAMLLVLESLLSRSRA